MEFLPAICPTCAGNLQLPNDRESVQCMYCGNTVVVKQAVQAASGVNTHNYLALAKSAADGGNSEEAYDYYTKILEYEPNNSEAWFGKAEAAGLMSKLADLRVPEMISGFERAIAVSADADKYAMARRANLSLNAVCTAFHGTAKQHLLEYVALDNSWMEYLGRCRLILLGFEKAHAFDPSERVTIDNIIMLCADNIRGVKYNDPYANNVSKVWVLPGAYENELRQKMLWYAAKLQKLDPNYRMPVVERQKAGACFVATATMGDYDHPLVLILREFRDEILSKSPIGRNFILAYYRAGPFLASRIRTSVGLQKISRILLVRPAAGMAGIIIRRARISRKGE